MVNSNNVLDKYDLQKKCLIIVLNKKKCSGHAKVVRMLIDRGAKIDYEDPGHCSCLLLAAIHGNFFSPKTKKKSQ